MADDGLTTNEREAVYAIARAYAGDADGLTARCETIGCNACDTNIDVRVRVYTDAVVGGVVVRVRADVEA